MCTWQKFYRISFSFHTYSCCRFILIGHWFVVCDRYTLHCLQLLFEKRARFSRSKKKDEETKLTKTIIRFFPIEFDSTFQSLLILKNANCEITAFAHRNHSHRHHHHRHRRHRCRHHPIIFDRFLLSLIIIKKNYRAANLHITVFSVKFIYCFGQTAWQNCIVLYTYWHRVNVIVWMCNCIWNR